MEDRGAAREELLELLGHGRAKKVMFERNADEGEMEIGQVSGMIRELMPAGEIVEEIVAEFNLGIGRLGDWRI